MTNRIPNGLKRALWAPGVGWMAVALACATPPNPELESLRTRYEEAARTTAISDHAPLELHEANTALERAEQAWEARHDEDEARHLIYLAGRRIEIAQVASEASRARENARRLAEERGEILINARTREVGRALQAAEAARRDAETARSEAQAQAREAEKARLVAEQRGREAEEALQAAEKRRLEAEMARQTAKERGLEADEAREEAERARKEAQDLAVSERRLREALAELEARPTDRGMVLTLGDVLFEFDRSELQPGAMQSLYRLVQFLQEYPDRQLLIEGHTDGLGSTVYNAELSQRRAGAVQQFLEEQGVAADRVMSTGFGEEYPIASNETAEGRQRNRRVEVVILDAGQLAIEQQRVPPPVEAEPQR